jgi:hypothetical protein
MAGIFDVQMEDGTKPTGRAAVHAMDAARAVKCPADRMNDLIAEWNAVCLTFFRH